MRFVDLLSVYQSAERMAIESYVKYGCSPHSGAEGREFLSRKSKKNPSFSVSNIFNKKKTLKKICLQHNLLCFFLTSQSVQFSSLALLYVKVLFMSDHVFIQKFPQTKPLFVFFLLVINQNQKCKKYNLTLLL